MDSYETKRPFNGHFVTLNLNLFSWWLSVASSFIRLQHILEENNLNREDQNQSQSLRVLPSLGVQLFITIDEYLKLP